jgi:hypothetical protein
MKNKRSTHRSFPGRLTLEDWRALPGFARRDMIHRAECELLHCHALCAGKQCRRHRTCCADDAIECERSLWQRALPNPRPLRRELARLYSLARLRGPERETCKGALRSFAWTAGLYDPWNAPALFPGEKKQPVSNTNTPPFSQI